MNKDNVIDFQEWKEKRSIQNIFGEAFWKSVVVDNCSTTTFTIEFDDGVILSGVVDSDNFDPKKV